MVVTTWIYGGSVIRLSQVTEILEKLTDVLGHEGFALLLFWFFFKYMLFWDINDIVCDT